MVFPDKHIKFSESLLGLGSLVITLLNTPKSLDSIWKELKHTQNHNGLFCNHNFENLVLTIDILYAIGMLDLNPNGFLEINQNANINEMNFA